MQRRDDSIDSLLAGDLLNPITSGRRVFQPEIDEGSVIDDLATLVRAFIHFVLC
jgi:hypothetical protein